jgi:hypothetical protein
MRIIVIATCLVLGSIGCKDAASPAPRPTRFSLTSDPGDYIGGGRAYLYTLADAIIVVEANGGHLSLNITGDESWFADFQLPNTLTRLERGTYSGLSRFPFHNQAVGGLSWSGEGRGCNTLTGSMVIEAVTYRNGDLSLIDLRFEQHCEGQTPALRGVIHWDADDPTTLRGPVTPIPAGLWRPATGATPATGNYMYLVSDVGDFVGQGQTLTYTPANATIGVTASTGHVAITGGGWNGDFQAMVSLSDIRPGYYANLQRYPFHNPARGGLAWFGQGRGCNELTGWFAVDAVTYSGATITAIDLRFEQHCEGGTPALRGAIRWRE